MVESDKYSNVSINSGVAVLQVDTPSDHATGSTIGFTEFSVKHGQTYGSSEGKTIAFGASYGQGDYVVTSNNNATTRNATPYTVPLLQWFIGQIRWLNNTNVEFDNGTNIAVHHSGIPSGPLSVHMVVLDMYAGQGTWFGSAFNSVKTFAQAGNALNFRAYYDYNPEAPVTLKTDWIFARKTNFEEPNASILNLVLDKPSAPRTLQAINGDSYVTITLVTEYRIYRSGTSGTGYTLIGTSTTTTYNDTGLIDGNTYYYVLTAVNSIGESYNSNEVSATPQILITVPSASRNLVATASDSKVTLEWLTPSNTGGSPITGYHIYESETSGKGYFSIGTSTTTSYTDVVVINGNTYYYVVSAVNSVGESYYSNEVSATPHISNQVSLSSKSTSNITTTPIYLPTMVIAFVMLITLKNRFKNNKK